MPPNRLHPTHRPPQMILRPMQAPIHRRHIIGAGLGKGWDLLGNQRGKDIKRQGDSPDQNHKQHSARKGAWLYFGQSLCRSGGHLGSGGLVQGGVHLVNRRQQVTARAGWDGSGRQFGCSLQGLQVISPATCGRQGHLGLGFQSRLPCLGQTGLHLTRGLLAQHI